MIGQSVGSDASRLSCFLFRPRKSCENRRKRSHINASNASIIRTSTPPAQTAHVRFHERKRVHTRLSEKDRTQGLTRRNTGRFGRGRYYYPRSVPHVSETLRGQMSERQTLPLLGLGRVCSRRTQKAFGTAMRSCASLFRRRRGPAGPRDLFTFVEIAACMPCSRYFFRFFRRSSLCRSCASCVSARSFSARSSMVFGRNRQDFLL